MNRDELPRNRPGPSAHSSCVEKLHCNNYCIISSVLTLCCLTSVADAADKMNSVPASGCSVEAVYNARLVDSASESSCAVSVIKLDWESVSDCDLATLTTSIDCIIATGMILILTLQVIALLYKHLTCLHHWTVDVQFGCQLTVT